MSAGPTCMIRAALARLGIDLEASEAARAGRLVPWKPQVRFRRPGRPGTGSRPVLRGEISELLPGDPRAGKVRAATRTLAELLAQTPTWAPPDLTGVRAVAQPQLSAGNLGTSLK